MKILMNIFKRCAICTVIMTAPAGAAAIAISILLSGCVDRIASSFTHG